MIIPENCDMWEEDFVVCEGAAATKAKVNNACNDNKETKLSAYFDRQNLISMVAGEEVVFTVTTIFEYEGQTIAFEGSDTVRVVEP